MINDFKKFIMRGNVIDMAVGVIIGAAFTTIIKSLVADIIMPVIGLFTSGVDFTDIFITLKEGADVAGPYATLEAAQKAGAVTMNIGTFVNGVVVFLIVAFAVFMLVKGVEKMRKKEEAAPEAPKAPPAEEVLLTEIRDLLKK